MNFCLICKATKLPLVTDHSHATGYIRGLLCSLCNCRLGTYEHRLIEPRRAKGSYKIWVTKYSNEIEEHLQRNTGILYQKTKIDGAWNLVMEMNWDTTCQNN